jgi:hypothetical protein
MLQSMNETIFLLLPVASAPKLMFIISLTLILSACELRDPFYFEQKEVRNALKGECHKIFDPWFFLSIDYP